MYLNYDWTSKGSKRLRYEDVITDQTSHKNGQFYTLSFPTYCFVLAKRSSYNTALHLSTDQLRTADLERALHYRRSTATIIKCFLLTLNSGQISNKQAGTKIQPNSESIPLEVLETSSKCRRSLFSSRYGTLKVEENSI